MIYDDIRRAHRYFPNHAAWKILFDHLATLTAESPDGPTDLMPDGDLIAIVQTYTTKPIERCVVESHERYVDVQVVLDGEEWFDSFVRDTLTIDTPFDADKDATFYKPSDAPEPPHARVSLVPGRFAVLFPTDAHRPQIMPFSATGPQQIRKVVYKVDCNLLGATE